MSGFTVHPAKVQRPPLRGETLARDRLLDWLHVQIHHRLVLVLADAGYGKTTLLADFSGRTRLRTLWYRLDEDDRDWVTFLNHLVAAGREHDPGFAPRTAAMLADMDVAGPTIDVVVDTFIRELPSIAEQGAVLILDDFHLVDEAPDAKLIARELVTRGPERLTLVFSSRRSPGLPLAKLRASGEVAELRTDDLRFDVDETARLFRETYGQPLEQDVLADLSARTEGWAASLQLVQAALRDRSPSEIRRIVRNLTGADHELYDYLAEEVVGDLPEDLQQFLMRTSILQAVTPELAALVTEMPADRIRPLMVQAERLGLLSRRGRTSRENLRYHPLVRDFLESRLGKAGGGTRELHQRVARATEAVDWRVACHHYAMTADNGGIARVIEASLEEILATGETAAAESHLSGMRDRETSPSFEVIRSRSELRRGAYDRALQLARGAYEGAPSSPAVLVNLYSIAMTVGAFEIAKQAAADLRSSAGDSIYQDLGEAMTTILDVSMDGDLVLGLARLQGLVQQQRARRQSHFEGVTLLNISAFYQGQGDARKALAAADESLLLLQSRGRRDEIAALRCIRGWALAHLGDIHEARVASEEEGEADLGGLAAAESLFERADVEAMYGSIDRANDQLKMAASPLQRHPWLISRFEVSAAQVAIRRGDLKQADDLTKAFRVGLSTWVALKARQLALRSQAQLLNGHGNWLGSLEAALEHARSQGADFWVKYCETLRAVALGGAHLADFLRRPSAELATYLSIHAELVVGRLAGLDEHSRRAIEEEAGRRPERWLSALRACVDEKAPSAVQAGMILDTIGTREDIPRLRSLGRRLSRTPHAHLGKGLARRLAPRVFVEDQGRLAIRVGDHSIEGAAIRRKVLALLCFLLTRHRFSAAKDEVLDALWPDFDPGVALNSLNQTIYFLRRVLESDYKEDTSPGYVRHESDVVWLDRQLVSSRSQLCNDFVRGLPLVPTPEDVDRLVGMYQGRFALDFAYESWADEFRDSLHASYLAVVENAIAADTASGHFTRGISVARRTLQVDSEAEQVELSMLRLLRLSGAHAAAAEQYEHYAAVLKETLGVEPPPLDAL